MSTPGVCVTVTASTTAELCQRRDAVTDADLIELRLDSVSDPDAAGALAGRRTPVIVTCRPVWEGGQFTGSEQERRRILGDALALGAEYVDIEWGADFQDLVSHAGGRRIILSMHDFDGVPDDLGERARAMRSTGAEVIKLAVKANRLSDCIPLLKLGSTIGKSGGSVLVAMGPRGMTSRILAQRFNSLWTYAGALAGVGQLTPATLIEQYRFRALSDATTVYGLVGSPVAHSVSPAMHNAAFRAAGLDAVYLPLDAADVEDFVGFAEAIGLVGASVTIPFKVPLYERAEEVDAIARSIGALNTIRVVNGRWHGGNTDVGGFLQPLQDRRVALQGLRAAILGAGGSARAVAIALTSCGADVAVHARNRAQAEEVATLVSGAAGSWPPEPGSWDLLVNCTPIGMHPNVDETPIARELLTGRLAYDLIYNPMDTRLLRDAECMGLQTIGGIDMLVAQAHAQFQWWTNVRPHSGVMRTAALKRLSEFSSHEHDIV